MTARISETVRRWSSATHDDHFSAPWQGYWHRHGDSRADSYDQDGDHHHRGDHDGSGCGETTEPRLVAVSDSRAVEGSFEVFTVSLSGAVQSSLDVKLSVIAGSATSGTDYGNAMQVSFDGGAHWTGVQCGSVKLAAGIDDFLVRVATIDDTKVESPETFVLAASAGGGTACGTATIADNDTCAPQPTVLSVSDPVLTEGEHAVFAVTLSQAVTSATAVALALAAGSAGAGTDYVSALEASFDGGTSWIAISGGSVAVPAGSAEFLVRAATIDDLRIENGETFALTASTAAGSVTGTATIADNDLPLSMTIDNAQTFEGDVLDFRLAFAETPLTAGVIQLTLADGTAQGGLDFEQAIQVSRDGGTNWTVLGTDGVLDIAAGETSLLLRVQTIDDPDAEQVETMTIAARQLDVGTAVIGVGEIIDTDSSRIGHATAPDATGQAAVASLMLTADELARQTAAVPLAA